MLESNTPTWSCVLLLLVVTLSFNKSFILVSKRLDVGGIPQHECYYKVAS